MAAKKKRAYVRRGRVDPDEEGMEGNDELDPETVTETVLEMGRATQAQKEPKAKIKRLTPDGKSQYLDQVLLELVNEDWLAETYGGGKYQVMKEGVRADNTWGYLGHDTYEIDDELPFKGSLRKQVLDKAEEAARQGPIHNADGSLAGRGGGGGANALIEAGVFNLLKSHQENAQVSQQFFLTMMEQSRQSSQTMQTMMLEMMKQGQSKGGMSETMEKLMPLLLVVAPELFKLIGAKRTNMLEELLPLVEQLKPKDEGQKLEDTLTMISKLKDAAEMFSPNASGGESSWSSMMEKAMEVLPTLLVQRNTAPAAAAPAASASARAAASPTATAPAPTLPQPASVGDAPLMIETADDVWRVIGERIDQVRLMAMTGRNAARIAMVVVEFASPEQRALLSEVLADDKFEEEFFSKFPQMKVYTRWTQEFIGVMRDELLGPSDDDDDDGGEENDDETASSTGDGK